MTAFAVVGNNFTEHVQAMKVADSSVSHQEETVSVLTKMFYKYSRSYENSFRTHKPPETRISN